MEEYEFIKYLGVGAFAWVRLVRRKTGKREQLVMKTQKISDQAENEPIIMHRLHHPNIVRFHKSGIQFDFVFILMDYIAGDTLEHVMEKTPGEKVSKDALGIFLKLMLGIDHMHSLQILHRDLKPANVMVNSSFTMVKIIDFGLSRDVTTKTNVALRGPSSYSAPEMFRFPTDEWNQKYTYTSDIWSAGAILHKIATGNSPQDLWLNLKTLEELPRLMEEILGNIEGLPSAVKNVCVKVLKLKPKDRPSSREILAFEELKLSIQGYLDDLDPSQKEIVMQQLDKIE